jgi:predicted nucleic acid-binding Zn ribbon protein
MAQSIVDRRDQLTPACAQCGKVLPPDGPSPDFCNESCQQWWHAKRSDKKAA